MKQFQRRTISRPYAKAAFDVAVQQNDLATWELFLENAAIIVSDTTMGAWLSDPDLKEDNFFELFFSLLNDSLTMENKNFLQLLFANRRLQMLPEISAMFIEMRKAFEKIIDVNIISVFNLADEQKQQLLNRLEKKLNKKIQPHYVLDPAIIGGTVIHAGDLVIDGSVKTYLQRLVSHIKGNSLCD